MAETTLLERSDHWVLPLGGEVVTQCRYDYAFTLVAGELEPSLELRIEQVFTLHGPDGAEDSFDPDADPQDMADTLRLLRGTVTRSIARKDGQLEIEFEDGSLVRVPPSSDHEAWTLIGTKSGILMASVPGGGLAAWSE